MRSAGGYYLFLEQRVEDLVATTPDVVIAQKQLDIPVANEPATALVIGYDKRKGEDAGAQSRSDTVMLVRADPNTDSISLLSFPRDLIVDVTCPGRLTYRGRINQAYSDCGTTGTLQTVRNLTGLSVHYLVTVNFRGFRHVVDSVGGVWLDVDRRYFNNVSGPAGYATINLQPGYQKLTGYQALDYVRYRHTDSDLYRLARQQLFVRAPQGADQGRAVGDEPRAGRAEARRGDHEERRGRPRRRQEGRHRPAALLRALRVRPAARSRLPVHDRRARGLRRADDADREHPRGRAGVRAPRRRVAREGDRRRAEREAEEEGGEGAAAA